MPVLTQHRDDAISRPVNCATPTLMATGAKTKFEPPLNNPKTSPVDYDDPSFKSSWSHYAWVTAGCSTVIFSLANSIRGSIASRIWLEPILAGYIGYLFADLGSGVYHWAVDNYGDISTPIFGMQIDAFVRHHKWPTLVTKLEFANLVHEVARIVTFFVLPINLLCHNHPAVMAFVAVASGFIIFSLQIHVWAHITKNKLPRIVAALQDVGVLITRSQHAVHHQQPINNTYCIVNGVWNRVLDEHKVFAALEMVVFNTLGVRPRSWDESNSDFVEEVDDVSPAT